VQKKVHKYFVDSAHSGARVDKYVVSMLDGFSRSHVQKLIDNGHVTVGGERVSAHHRVYKGNEVTVYVPELRKEGVVPEDIPLDILYEDEHIIVINKPAGLVVHPATGNYSHTLVNALLNHTGDLSTVGGEMKRGIVHRLDMGTSGCMVVAKKDGAHLRLSAQFKDREVFKEYLALVKGVCRLDFGRVTVSLGRHPTRRTKMSVRRPESGRDAESEYEVIKRFKDATLIKVVMRSGRTHQIRVHMAHIGYPVVGDSQYGHGARGLAARLGVERQMLHAHRLGFRHPATNEYVQFEAPMPEDMKKAIAQLEAE